MNPFDLAPKTLELRERLLAFMDEHIYPNEEQVAAEAAAQTFESEAGWSHCDTIERLKGVAREQGLWNLFLPHSERAPEGLTNYEYAPLAEIMGRVYWASEVFNCSAPDTGNMETIERYGTEEHKDRWLEPLLRGEIRSAFLMTEPAVASSDATNIECDIRREGDEYVINGRKWWSTGAGTSHCKVYVVMGKTDPTADRHHQQSMVLVPADAPGATLVRSLRVFGYNHSPFGHMEVDLKDVRVPVSNILLGEGRGFEIAQGRLGPGRIHHSMRSIGAAERALELMCARLSAREAFGHKLVEEGVWVERIAESRMLIDQARLLTLKAAWMMDTVGNKVAQSEIAMIKVVAPNMACKVIDWAIQAHGGAGVTPDTPLAFSFADQRTLRIADGPDEVHRRQIARLELRRLGLAARRPVVG
ncbi:MAG: acyl-CoA dehydrogenase family protein [Dermatophilaceae bacterium]